MKRFNKNKALNKLNNRNNSNIKVISITISVFILIVAIMYFSFARFEKSATYSLIDGTFVIPMKTLKETMIELANNGNEYLEYDGVATLGENGTTDNNLRYGGGGYNNILFNCTTTNPKEMSSSTCERWKIIGLMNNIEDENGKKDSRVKIIRAEMLHGIAERDNLANALFSWDSSSSSVNNGYGINQWGESGNYEGSDIMRELNTDYLGNITVGTDDYWFSDPNNTKEVKRVSTPLNQNAQNMIQTVKWHTGAVPDETTSNWTTKNMYEWERSSNTGKRCSSGTSCNDNVTRTTTWIGKVGLMYPSDFGYSTRGGRNTDKTTCLNTSLYNWKNLDACLNSTIQYNFSYLQGVKTMTSLGRSNNATSTFEFWPNGSLQASYSGYGGYIFPVVFLKDNVYVAGGNGLYDNPYKLVLK